MNRGIIAGLALALAPCAVSADAQPTWTLYSDDDAVSLNYVVAGSEEPGPTLLCDRVRGHNATPGRLTVFFFTDATLRAPTVTLHLRSGAVSVDLPASVQSDEDSGGSELQARLALGAPILAQFARTGRIRFQVGSERASPRAASPAMVAELLAGCRR